jgi:phospholipase/lecithinase/hemolysin
MGREEMRKYQLAAALFAASILAGCGGGGAGDQSSKVKFTSQVSFGDSLSDVGTYMGAQFTINGAGKNWTELMAAQVGVAAPCAAETGLDGTGIYAAYSVTPVFHNTGATPCYAYAQGGARVTNAVGIGNKNNPAQPGFALTVPVATQVANHLAAVGSFSGSEVVYVLAGANDVLTQAGTYPVLTGTYGYTPSAALTAVTASTTIAANDLVALIAAPTTGMIAKGAKYIVVVNIPDIAGTPYGAGAELATPGSKALIDGLVTTFNTQLKAQLAGNANVLLVDAYTINHDQVVNPAPYGLTNVTTAACTTASSSTCTPTTLQAGYDGHWLFADGVHPTPFGYWLLARYVAKEMLVKGWL